jgi:hypothetical protein
MRLKNRRNSVFHPMSRRDFRLLSRPLLRIFGFIPFRKFGGFAVLGVSQPFREASWGIIIGLKN